MNSQEKVLIYDLLKKASDSLMGFKSPDFPDETPDFDSMSGEPESVQVTPPAEVRTAPQEAAAPVATPHIKPISTSAATTAPSVTPVTAVPQPLSPSLSALQEKITACQRCPLCKTRKKSVPGTGCTSPYVMVIGEGPGYEEEMQGLPFVGPAGQLLDKMLAAIELSRNSNTYIANIVKCRPPQNRNPYPEEAEACSSFLQTQIALLKPKMILCAGTVAAKTLLKTEMGVTRLRGNFYEYAGIPVAVTYHPDALLRDETLKRPAWEDLKQFKLKLLEVAPDYQKSFMGPQG